MPTSRKGSNNSRLLRKIKQTIAQFAMFHPGDRVLVALSGGPDSMALLHSLRQLAPELSIQLGVAHLNHQLRGGASERDAAFAAETADRCSLPFHTRSEDVNAYRIAHRLSPEEAARERRYAFLVQTAQEHGFERIAVGHTADDNAELVLMVVLRGSGPRGLAGIPPVRGPIVRPLIQTARPEILAFLQAGRFSWVEDASNRDEGLLRNRIRHRVIPFLQEMVHPAVADSLNRLSGIMRAEEAWLDVQTDSMFEHCLVSMEGQRVCLAVDRLRELHPGAQRRIVRKAVNVVKGGLRRLAFSHVEAVLNLINGEPPESHADLPEALQVDRCHAELVFSVDASPGEQGMDTGPFAYELRKPGLLNIPEIGMVLDLSVADRADPPDIRLAGQQVAFFDMEKVRFPVTVRNARPGDRFQPLGMDGTQKLSDYFINNKVPQMKRRRCPLLLSRNTIIWVVGHRIAETVKVDASTKTLLRGELLLA